MNQPLLLPDLVSLAASRTPHAIALSCQGETMNYEALALKIQQLSSCLMALDLQRGERVAVYLEKRFETVIACFGAAAAGAVFVPVNPVLKAEQVAHILQDCNVRVLVTSAKRLQTLQAVLPACTDVAHLLLVDEVHATVSVDSVVPGQQLAWSALSLSPVRTPHRVIDQDMAAILYTSGSTGKPKGVVLSHRNLVAGAVSVASYLENQADDTLLAVLPLSFDAGFSQLTTAFHAGARVVLLNYLLPQDVLRTLVAERVTGLTAVPPLYIQLSQQTWPEGVRQNLRYFANTGGRMPRETLDRIRAQVPQARPFLMYGLTESFRSTYLPPEDVDRRPDSIGKAIPNAEILVLREDGTPCAADEPGELVHRGALVGLGYWNDVEKTAERYKVLTPQSTGQPLGLPLPEYAVFSGDTVRRDAQGFLYFVGRRDEMIKSSGYRVSPTEVEEVLYASHCIAECAAFGTPHPDKGQEIQVVASLAAGQDETVLAALYALCRQQMPPYMVPAGITLVRGPLPRNANGKIDRKQLAAAVVQADDTPAQSKVATSGECLHATP